MQTQNINIAGLINRSRRFKYEWMKATSGNVSFVTEHDIKRLRSYFESMRAYIAFSQSQPTLDLPETAGGRNIELGAGPEVRKVENESINDMLELWNILEHELAHSQSSRLAARLLEHDHGRALAIIQNMENFLEEYIVKILPLDLPESSPMQQGVGAGRQGINPS
jgi:hypothetical protein